MYAYEDLMTLLEDGGSSTARPRTCRPPRRSPSAGAPGAGMERPELATLLAYAKRLLARVAGDVVASSTTRGWSATCASYFPRAVVERFGAPARTSTRCGAS